MAQPFEVYGPFMFNRKIVAEKEHRKKVWATIDEQYRFLSEARGAYLLSLRNKQNYKPVYVGITNSLGFSKEVFNSSNLVKILHRLKGHRGTLCVHLFAKPKSVHTGFSINIPPDRLDWIEVMLLWCCRRKDPNMLNKSNTLFLEDVEIKHVTSQFKRGPQTQNVETLVNAIGW
jgi:hypothetical protein